MIPPMSAALVRAACPHDCPDTCAMLVTVQDGRAIKVQGDPAHPVTKGFLCSKVSRYVERTYHAGRVGHRVTSQQQTPLHRNGAGWSRCRGSACRGLWAVVRFC